MYIFTFETDDGENVVIKEMCHDDEGAIEFGSFYALCRGITLEKITRGKTVWERELDD